MCQLLSYYLLASNPFPGSELCASGMATLLTTLQLCPRLCWRLPIGGAQETVEAWRKQKGWCSFLFALCFFPVPCCSHQHQHYPAQLVHPRGEAVPSCSSCWIEFAVFPILGHPQRPTPFRQHASREGPSPWWSSELRPACTSRAVPPPQSLSFIASGPLIQVFSSIILNFILCFFLSQGQWLLHVVTTYHDTIGFSCCLSVINLLYLSNIYFYEISSVTITGVISVSRVYLDWHQYLQQEADSQR